MSQLSFKRDFAYKFVKPTSFINSQETPKLILPLWRSNRLSLIRSYVFLESFFRELTITKKSTVSIKYKRADKKTHLKTIYFIHILLKQTDFFMFILNYLPEPKALSSSLGYVLIYPFHHFVIQVPCDTKQPIFTYKIIPYLKLLTNAKIYQDLFR